MHSIDVAQSKSNKQTTPLIRSSPHSLKLKKSMMQAKGFLKNWALGVMSSKFYLTTFLKPLPYIRWFMTKKASQLITFFSKVIWHTTKFILLKEEKLDRKYPS